MAVLSLNVEPGMYCPAMARLSDGSPLAGPNSWVFWAALSPPTHSERL